MSIPMSIRTSIHTSIHTSVHMSMHRSRHMSMPMSASKPGYTYTQEHKIVKKMKIPNFLKNTIVHMNRNTVAPIVDTAPDLMYT